MANARLLIGLALAAAVFATGAQGKPKPAPAQLPTPATQPERHEPVVLNPHASIAFASRGGVESFQTDGDRTVYFRDKLGKWYRAILASPDPALSMETTLTYNVDFAGSLDETGYVFVRGRRHAFRSFDEVDGPPVRPRPKVEAVQAPATGKPRVEKAPAAFH